MQSERKAVKEMQDKQKESMGKIQDSNLLSEVPEMTTDCRDFMLTTERLIIQPYRDSFLEAYYTEFTDEITKYQYPDSFSDINAADEILSGFVKAMEQGDMLELVILTRDGEFVGSMEVFDIKEKTPEVGIWLKESAHGKGYGYEALRGLIDDLNSTGKYQYYIYEVDIRNAPSTHLVEKFCFEKVACEEITTKTGKTLHSQTYHIFR